MAVADCTSCIALLQAPDMAAEYAAKLAMLHEESAARAEGDLRRRQERYVMLADLQAQAQVCVSCKALCVQLCISCRHLCKCVLD